MAISQDAPLSLYHQKPDSEIIREQVYDLVIILGFKFLKVRNTEEKPETYPVTVSLYTQ